MGSTGAPSLLRFATKNAVHPEPVVTLDLDAPPLKRATMVEWMNEKPDDARRLDFLPPA